MKSAHVKLPFDCKVTWLGTFITSAGFLHIYLIISPNHKSEIPSYSQVLPTLTGKGLCRLVHYGVGILGTILEFHLTQGLNWYPWISGFLGFFTFFQTYRLSPVSLFAWPYLSPPLETEQFHICHYIPAHSWARTWCSISILCVDQ